VVESTITATPCSWAILAMVLQIDNIQTRVADQFEEDQFGAIIDCPAKALRDRGHRRSES
jgi:hypothetical protein